MRPALSGVASNVVPVSIDQDVRSGLAAELDALAPGAELVAALERLSPAALTGEDLASYVRACARAQSQAAAGFLEAIHHLGRAQAGRTDRRPELDEFSGDEVSAILGWSRTMAAPQARPGRRSVRSAARGRRRAPERVAGRAQGAAVLRVDARPRRRPRPPRLLRAPAGGPRAAGGRAHPAHRGDRGRARSGVGEATPEAGREERPGDPLAQPVGHGHPVDLRRQRRRRPVHARPGRRPRRRGARAGGADPGRRPARRGGRAAARRLPGGPRRPTRRPHAGRGVPRPAALRARRRTGAARGLGPDDLGPDDSAPDDSGPDDWAATTDRVRRTTTVRRPRHAPTPRVRPPARRTDAGRPRPPGPSRARPPADARRARARPGTRAQRDLGAPPAALDGPRARPAPGHGPRLRHRARRRRPRPAPTPSPRRVAGGAHRRRRPPPARSARPPTTPPPRPVPHAPGTSRAPPSSSSRSRRRCWPP